ncbi:hypothetical protein LPJ74_001322 [Coemansia sp. RSA 1843]|nr:hypothetical protein LPJ74_001322 [Coemansia sp. RSA 1843]
MARNDEVCVLKVPLQAVSWRRKYRPPLRKLVKTTNYNTRHSYNFARWIFIYELREDIDFKLDRYVCVPFFREVILKVNGGKTTAVGKARKKKPKAKTEAKLKGAKPTEIDKPDTTEFRELIAKHWDMYAKSSRIKQKKQPYMAQIAGYEAQKIHTAFLVSVKNNLGNCLRRAVNMLCRSKIEALAKRIELKAAGASAATIQDSLRAEVWGPADKAKECVKRGKIIEAELDAHIYERIKDLQSVFYIYENDAPSEKGLYYDIKYDPIKHIKTFFLLARFFQQTKPRSFQCIPLRTQWIPCHVHIDKAILCQWFLGVMNKGQKLTNDLWDEGGKVFEGSVQTDGVSISIFKKCKAKKKINNSTDQTNNIKTPDTASAAKTKTPKSKKGKGEDGFEFEYIGSVDQDKLCAMEGKCVLIDPGRRNLLFCMHEYSSIGNPWLFRFTRNHKAKLTRSTKFRRILEAAKKMYPENAIIEAERRLAEVPCTTVDLGEFKRFIEVQAEVWPLLSKFYSCTQTNRTNKKPLHRQLRLAAYLNSQRADHILANLIHEQFGPDPVLILGNWSADTCKYHEPIQGVGMRRMLRKHGFKVYLLDEFRTSTFCPVCCENRLMHPEELEADNTDGLAQKPPSPVESECSSRQGMARRQWPRGQGVELAGGDSSSTVFSELSIHRVSSDGDSDTIASDSSGSATPSPCVDERKTGKELVHCNVDINMQRGRYSGSNEDSIPFLALCLMRLTQASNGTGPCARAVRWIVDARVVAVLGGISMVAPLVGFIILEKLVADEMDFYSPVFMQALVHGMTALLIEVLTNRRFGLFVRAPHPLRVASMLPLVAIYCAGVVLSQAAHRLNSIHGTFQTIQCALPLATAALLATVRSHPQSVVASRLRRAVAHVSSHLPADSKDAAGSEVGQWVAWPLTVALGATVWAPAHNMIIATENADGTGLNVRPRGVAIAYALGSVALSLASLAMHALLLVGTSEFIARRPGLSAAGFLRHFAPLCMISLLVLWPVAEKPLYVLQTLDARVLGACVGVACLGALSLIARTAMLSAPASDGVFGVAVVSQTKPLVCLAIGWWIYGYTYTARQTMAFFVALALIVVWIAQRLLFSKPPVGPILSLHCYCKPTV